MFDFSHWQEKLDIKINILCIDFFGRLIHSCQYFLILDSNDFDSFCSACSDKNPPLKIANFSVNF